MIKRNVLPGVSATTGAIQWVGGKTLVAAFGTWSTATVTLQVTYDGSTWINVDQNGSPIAFTGANDGTIADLPNNATGFRFEFSGGGSPSLTLVLDTVK